MQANNLVGPLILPTNRLYDDRGFFEETFTELRLKELGVPRFVQENHSRSNKYVLRGLHYQLNPAAQGKLVMCVAGSILDVVVDMRKKSNTYGWWASFILNEDRPELLYVPPGFAHGFLVKESAHIIYKVTEYYDKKLDRGIRWDDKDICIDWQINEDDKKHLLISDKDRLASSFMHADNNF